jgi:hypothetical protein
VVGAGWVEIGGGGHRLGGGGRLAGLGKMTPENSGRIRENDPPWGGHLGGRTLQKCRKTRYKILAHFLAKSIKILAQFLAKPMYFLAQILAHILAHILAQDLHILAHILAAHLAGLGECGGGGAVMCWECLRVGG